MENFYRRGPSPFRPDGTTVDTDIRFAGGSKLKVYGGSPYNNFRLRFGNVDGEGWWVGPNSLDQLIVELLYIRKDTQKFKDGIDLDIEVGAAPAPPPRDMIDAPEYVEEDEEEIHDEGQAHF